MTIVDNKTMFLSQSNCRSHSDLASETLVFDKLVEKSTIVIRIIAHNSNSIICKLITLEKSELELKKNFFD